MSQCLRLPIDDSVLQAGYKNEQYRNEWGFRHYGADFTSASRQRTLMGLGDGEVIAAGLDGTQGEGSGCGYVLIVRYNACRNWKTGRDADLVCTYMHLASLPEVRAGQQVTTQTQLGVYGNTGGNTSGPHLHIQFDTDVAFALCCSGLASAGHALLKAGTVDSTVDPLHVLFRAESQTLTGHSSGWWDAKALAAVPVAAVEDDEVTVLQREVDALGLKCRAQADEIGRLTDIVDAVRVAVR